MIDWVLNVVVFSYANCSSTCFVTFVMHLSIFIFFSYKEYVL